MIVDRDDMRGANLIGIFDTNFYMVRPGRMTHHIRSVTLYKTTRDDYVVMTDVGIPIAEFDGRTPMHVLNTCMTAFASMSGNSRVSIDK